MNRPSAPLELFLKPLAPIYAGVMRARNAAFDRGLLPSFEVGCPVLSIGNLTAGGTGKTPVTAMLVQGFLARGAKVGIVSRGYGGEFKGVLRVPNDGRAETAVLCGDEPSWFAARFSNTPVYVGADRVAACQEMIANEDVSLIIADDAFQHRRLKRSVDIVVIDPTEPKWHYRSLPLGRLREGFASLSRARAVFITKTNLAERAQIDWIKKEISRACAERAKALDVFEFTFGITGFSPLESKFSNEVVSPGVIDELNLFMVSGIGRPQSFERSVKEATKARIAGHMIFRDHHVYSSEDLERVERSAREARADRIVITEKDAVKVPDWRPSVPVLVSRTEAKPKGDLKEFYEAVSRLLF